MKKLQPGSLKTNLGSARNRSVRYVCIACRTIYRHFPAPKRMDIDYCDCRANAVLLPKADLVLDKEGKCKELRGQVIL